MYIHWSTNIVATYNCREHISCDVPRVSLPAISSPMFVAFLELARGTIGTQSIIANPYPQK